MGVGLVLVAVAALTTSLPLFTVAGVVAGSGVGLVFNAAIVAAGRMASPEHRGETLAGMFLAAYTGITIPVILVGICVTWLSPVTVLVTFAAIVLVAVLFSTSRMLAQDAGGLNPFGCCGFLGTGRGRHMRGLASGAPPAEGDHHATRPEDHRDRTHRVPERLHL